MSKYLNVAILDDTGQEIVNALRGLTGRTPLTVNRRDPDRSLLDVTGKLIAEEIRELAVHTHAVYQYRGTVDSTDALPDAAEPGDVYEVADTGENSVYTSLGWELMGEKTITRDEIDRVVG